MILLGVLRMRIAAFRPVAWECGVFGDFNTEDVVRESLI